MPSDIQVLYNPKSAQDWTCYNSTDFSLSVGCFSTDIIQKYTKWSQIGVHALKIGQIFAKFQCTSFSITNIWKNDNMV